jgi:hypothetical protein
MTQPADRSSRSITNTYIGVVIVEAVVLVLLWWLGRSFS